MTEVSSAMAAYLDALQAQLNEAMTIAKTARRQGLDPTTDVEIPIANDLADRVEALLGIGGVAARIRELETEMSREEASLRIGDDFVARRFGETTREEILDHAIRTAMALLTEGVVAAPTEGIGKVGVGRNDDGSEYLKIYYAGPIRSAGGTAQALSVLVGDYVRQALGINRYIPRPEEVERYVEEIRQYNSIMSLQYLPNENEIRMIIQNCPVCIDGEATEQQEVSGYRNLERVETNTVRGGMALVVAEGLALKAPKIQKNVKKMKMTGWEWLDVLIGGATKSGDDDEVGVKPKDKYLRDLIAGRPVFSHPMRMGGFRLRYGRSRNTGFAAAGLNPATMHLLGEFLAVGTQMKVERPGKAAGIVPVDTIEGPTVVLKTGDLLRIDGYEDAVRLSPEVDRILDVGEILISYGEFLENNHVLVPAGYNDEWWRLEHEGVPPIDEIEAIGYALSGGFLHPAFQPFIDDLSPAAIDALSGLITRTGRVEGGTLRLPLDSELKHLLEEALVPHIVRDGECVVERYLVLLAVLGLDLSLKRRAVWDDAPRDSALALLQHLSGMKMRGKSGTRIGGRMGRPGKSKPREMKPPPHALFPVGEAGGARRSVQEASTYSARPNSDGGVIVTDVGERRCPVCNTVTFRNQCECGAHTLPVLRCPKCNRQVEGDQCPACGAGSVCSQKVAINVRDEFSEALERCGLRQGQVALVKGVKGVISREKVVEDLAKGVLRAKAGIFVFKDGTVRYDMIDLPVTHIRPSEVGVPPATLAALGYPTDIDGRSLEAPDQVVELKPQDILVSERCGEWLVRVAKFVDEELERVYGLEQYYRAETPADLIGRLIIGLAPHTSAGVLCRLVGFTKANVGYAHPFFHAAKRRNCFFGETTIEVWDYRTAWRKVTIREFVLEQFDLGRADLDHTGTFWSGTVQPYATRALDAVGRPHVRRITAVSIHRAPPTLLRIETAQGRVLAVTADHAMLVLEEARVRRVRACELRVDDPLPVAPGGTVLADRISLIDYVPCPDDIVFCLTVAEDHSVLANGIFTGQCDGDEDCVMLLLDGLLNFSRRFLPETRGGTMDAPLVLTTRLDPKEIDKESLNVDVGSGYPLEFYLSTLTFAHPKDLDHLIDRVERRLGTATQLEGFRFTHDTSDISKGPLDSTYTSLESMVEKLEAELDLAARIRAVDADDVAERVLNTHFIRDLMGNLSAFSKQKFRCTRCSAKYRRMPLGGKCAGCGQAVIPTVHESSVKKYLEMSRRMSREYQVSSYTRQRIEVLDLAIESTFGQPKIEQLGLADFL
jgi:DNA polymerase II large subunit